MKRAIAVFIAAVFFLLQLPLPLEAYEFPELITVALVPYAEESSRELFHLIEEIFKKLENTKGITLLGQDKTNAMLGYYLTYVSSEVSSGTEIRQMLSDARGELLFGNHKTALELLDNTEKAIEGRIARGGSNEGLYEIYLLKAKIHKANGDMQAVQKEYDKIAALNPELGLDSKLYSDWERETLNSSLIQIEGQRNGLIEVTSNPEGSEVFLNGIEKGITPLRLERLPPTRHCVEIKTVHYRPYCRCIDLKNGETITLGPLLPRIDVALPRQGINTVKPSQYKTELERSRMISQLGYHLGVDKVVLISIKEEEARDVASYRVGSTGLGAVQPLHSIVMDRAESGGRDLDLILLTGKVRNDLKADILTDPGRFVVSRSVGSIKLHEKKREPFYKRPLFWIAVGVSAAAGGTLGATLAGDDNKPTGGIEVNF